VSGIKVAALFVQTNGVYWGLDLVDPWDKERDARQYAGPYAVVAHPPCERWGRYWFGGPSAKERKTKGDDNGCFAAALAAVRRWGGVLEHPEASHAWHAFDLNAPPKDGRWIPADWVGGWTCCVEQGHYGHRARKATWLYAFGVDLPELRWGPAPSGIRLEDGYHSAEERRRKTAERRMRGDSGVLERQSHRERAATPQPVRDLLLGIARTARRLERAA
jgi:hypothetical protein